jgi:hypothetical protein
MEELGAVQGHATDRPEELTEIPRLIYRVTGFIGDLATTLDSAQAGKLAQAVVDKIIAANKPSALGSLAWAYAALPGERDPAQAGKLAQAVVDKIIATNEPYALALLAQALEKLAARLDSAQAGKLAQAIADKINAKNNPYVLGSLARAIKGSLQNVDQESKRLLKDAIAKGATKLQLFSQSLAVLETFRKLNPDETELSSFLIECLSSSALPGFEVFGDQPRRSALEGLANLKDEGKPGWLDDILIDFLKRPECVGEWETTTIKLLGASAGTDFHDDLWEVVAHPGFAAAVRRPMKRPRWLSW